MLRAEKGDNTTPRVKTLKIENVVGSKEVDYFIQQRTADGRGIAIAPRLPIKTL